MFGLNCIIIDLISILLGGQILFLLGIIIAKYAIFNKIIDKIGNNKIKYYSMFVITTIVIVEISKLILIPIFIFVLTNILREDIPRRRLGKHSTSIWFLHAFFYDYLFSDIVYADKYSILVFICLMILCLASSYIVNLIHSLMMICSNKTESVLKNYCS